MSQDTTFYLSPVTTYADTGSGLLTFSATLLEGFATRFSAYVLEPGSSQPRDITRKVKWTYLPVVGSAGEFVKEWTNKKTELHLRGTKKGRAVLQASYEQREIRVAVEILESDMLLYAPDGFVYRIPTEVWTRASDAPPGTRDPTSVVRYRPENLPGHLQSMLQNEVALANVPSGVTMPTPPLARNDLTPSDNITCFLLNLNSIMLSYSPRPPKDPLINSPGRHSSLEAPKPASPKPAAPKARKAPSRGKRG
jgi:hypothetical protein